MQCPETRYAARSVNGRHVREHVLVAERALGKRLPAGAIVHHVDENKANNASTNLVVCQDRAYHILLHARMRAQAACGYADYRKCRYCQRYDSRGAMNIIHRRAGERRGQELAYHSECCAGFFANRRAQRRAS